MNIDDNTINEQELINTISNSITMSVDISLLLITVNKFSRYFFQKGTIIYYDDYAVMRYTNNVALNSEKYVVCVSLRNRIIIMPLAHYDKNIKLPIKYEVNDENDLMNIISLIDETIFSIPVILYPSNVDLKKYISIFYNKICITVHSYTYEIPRSIMDMLYVEHEDFNPTTDANSEITVHTQARHQIFWEKEYIMDLLKSDIALITDTQDRLITEYNQIKNE